MDLIENNLVFVAFLHTILYLCRKSLIMRAIKNFITIILIIFWGSFFSSSQASDINNAPIDTIPASILPPITSFENNDSSRIVVVYIGGEYEEGVDRTSDISYLNDMRYFYRVIRNGYKIPRENINVLFGTGIEHSFEIDSCEIPVSFSWDLDDDGVNDIIGGSTTSRVEELFDSLAWYIQPDQHLLLVFDLHGEQSNGTLHEQMRLWDGELFITDLAAKLNSIQCASQCIILNSCYSGTFIKSLKKNGRIILTSANNTTSNGDPETYFFFIHRWTNAINGIYSMTFGSSDKNEDGYISMLESYNYSSIDDIGYNEPYNKIEHPNPAEPQYNSLPVELGESWAINNLPRLSGDLHIRDTETDWGESGNAGIEYPWSSPDIWIRNSNDGLTNQESEPINISENDSIVYVYTRINNNGYNTFEAYQRWLHLQWDYPSLRHDSIAWASHDIPFALTERIDTMSSQILVCEWHLPSELINYAQMHNGILNIDLLARISDTNEIAGQEYDARYPFEYHSLGNVITNPKMALYCVYHNDDYNEPITVKTNVSLNSGETSLRISPLHGGFSMHEVYYVINDTDTLRPTTDNPDVLLSNLQSQNQITIYCNTNVPRSQVQSTTDIPIALYDNNGALLGGCTLRMKIAGHGYIDPLEPGIGDSGGNEDGGEIGGPVFGGRMLSMTNVFEPVSCRWTDSRGNILGNNERLSIAMNATGEYTLTVKSQIDGEVASVSKEILPVPYFENVVSYGANITVSLLRPSINGMSLVVRSVVNENNSQRYELPEGLSVVSLNASSLDSGIYLVSLYYNNQLLETKQFAK